jgi:hypothetical protein
MLQFKTTLNSNDSSISPYVVSYNVTNLDSIAPNATVITPINNSQVNNLHNKK